MSAIVSKALRAEMLAFAGDQRDRTVASVKKMYKLHAKRAVKRRNVKCDQARVREKIDAKLRDQLAL